MAYEVREARSGSGIYFILGVIVVALGLVIWFVSGGDVPGPNDADVTINNEAPAGGAATVTTDAPATAPAATETAPAGNAAPAPAN